MAISLFIAFFISAIIGYLLKGAALKGKFLMPKGVPVVGGIAIGASFYAVCLFSIFFQKNPMPQALGIIYSSLPILIFGVIDDWRELSVKSKLIVQLIACALLIYSGVRTHIVYIGDVGNIIITFLWVVGITNALNHLDVADGVAGGVALIVSSAFVIISFLNPDPQTGALAFILLAATAGFLIYNLPEAKIYMGNSGSHFLGFVLAALALMVSYAPLERKVALLAPLLILGFAIFDTGFLILLRLGKRKLPFKKSNDHLALRFLELGFSKKKALSAMLALALCFSVCGILLVRATNFWGGVIVTGVILFSIAVAARMWKVKIDG